MYAGTLSEEKPDVIRQCMADVGFPPPPAVYHLLALVLADEDASHELREATLELLKHLHDGAIQSR
jgi:hypothetical protein